MVSLLHKMTRYLSHMSSRACKSLSVSFSKSSLKSSKSRQRELPSSVKIVASECRLQYKMTQYLHMNRLECKSLPSNS